MAGVDLEERWRTECRSLNLLEDVIVFQKKLIDIVLRCKILILCILASGTYNREAEYYQETLRVCKKRLPKKSLCDELNFWNNIMGNMLLYGLLDPTEKNLKNSKPVSQCV